MLLRPKSKSGHWMQWITLVAGIWLACLLCSAQAAVKSVGSVSPVPPSGGGTFATQLVVGDGQAASPDTRAWLQIDNGSQLQYGSLIVGDEETFVGEVNVLGNFLGPQGSPYTEFRISGNTQIGRQGFGRLNLTAGASMTTNALLVGVEDAGVGSISLSDPFTLLTFNNDLHVGQTGIGQLQIDRGARLQATGGNSTVHIGTNATGVGTVTVEGIDSILHSGANLKVGEAGEGKLIIGDGAIAMVEKSAGGNNTITVGRLGRIEMHGGTLSGNRPTSAPGIGTTVDGYLGGAGLVRSSVQFTDASVLEVGSSDVLRFDGKVDNQGSITVAGGELRFLDDFKNNSQGAMHDAPGRITLQDGTIRFLQPVTNAGDIFVNNGIITSANAPDNTNGHVTTNHFHGQIDNAGDIFVVSDTVATFHDSVKQRQNVTIFEGGTALYLADLDFDPDSLIAMAIAPSSMSSSLGAIQVAGQLTLDGDLTVAVSSDYTPAAGDRFELLTSTGGIAGAFDNITLPALPGNLEFELLYGPTSVMMEAQVAGQPGDYNNSGVVDAADYVVWRDRLGSSTSLANDDTPGVGQDDYDRWRANFGQVGEIITGAALAAVPAVPEPSNMIAVVVAVLSLAFCPRRSRGERETKAA